MVGGDHQRLSKSLVVRADPLGAVGGPGGTLDVTDRSDDANLPRLSRHAYGRKGGARLPGLSLAGLGVWTTRRVIAGLGKLTMVGKSTSPHQRYSSFCFGRRADRPTLTALETKAAAAR